MDTRQLQIVLKLQDEASKELRKLTGGLDGAERSTNKWGNSLDFVARQAKYAALAVAAAAAAGVTYGISVAAQLETAEVGLKTLLGSSEEAAATVARLKKEAARTPFELPGLSQATQLLTSVTKDGDKSIDILLDVGEALAAMGKGQTELDRIIVNLQQVAATGRAAMIDVRQFAFAGIPIYEMLSEATGKYGEELEDLISSGGVTFDLLTEMFDKANDEGGRFFNAYKNQAGTFNQAVSNMKDSIGIFFADLVQGTGIFGGLTEAMVRTSDVLGNYKSHLSNLRDTLTNFMLTLDAKTGLVTMLKEAWESVVESYNANLKPALLELWETLKPYKPYLEALAQVFGFMLVTALGMLIKTVQGFTLILIEALTWAIKVRTFFAGLFLDALDAVKDSIASLIIFVTDLIEAFKTAWEWATKITSKVGGFVKGAIDAVIPGRASGGPVAAGAPYMVGERDPELFVPSANGNIVPNHRLGSGVSITITGNTFMSTEEAAEKIGDMIISTLKLNHKFA